jgi:CheY-like chemotaxis protein
MRVLIVEDEPYMADAIRDGLRLEAIAADIAGDGDTALELLSTNSYDVAVLDRDIPGPSGDEVAERIVASGSGMSILMLTAADRLDDKASGFELGADDYLTKPFELRELVLRLRALDRRRAHNRPPVREIAGLRLDRALRREAAFALPRGRCDEDTSDCELGAAPWLIVRVRGETCASYRPGSIIGLVSSIIGGRVGEPRAGHDCAARGPMSGPGRCWLGWPGVVIGAGLAIGSAEFLGPNEERGWRLAGATIPLLHIRLVRLAARDGCRVDRLIRIQPAPRRRRRRQSHAEGLKGQCATTPGSWPGGGSA